MDKLRSRLAAIDFWAAFMTGAVGGLIIKGCWWLFNTMIMTESTRQEWLVVPLSGLLFYGLLVILNTLLWPFDMIGEITPDWFTLSNIIWVALGIAFLAFALNFI